MAVEHDAVEVVGFALGEVRALVHRGERRHGGITLRHLADHTDAPVARVRQEVGDNFETLGCDTKRKMARAGEQVVDGRHVDAHRELLLVAQEPRDVDKRSTLDVHDPLAVMLERDRARESFDERGRDFVA